MTAEELNTKQAELTERIDRLRGEQHSNRQRRTELALDAELGDQAAKAELARLMKTATAFEPDILHAEAALAEVRRRLLAINAAERDDLECENARRALALVESFKRRGAALNDAFGTALDEYVALTAEFSQLSALGYAPTTQALVKSNMRGAAAAKLMFTDLQIDFLAPHERRDFRSVIEGWSSVVEGRAKSRLAREAAKAA